MWGQTYSFVCTRGAHIGELFALQGVHFKVIVAAVLSDNHTLIDLYLRADKHASAVL